jgi:hypothetical protein
LGELLAEVGEQSARLVGALALVRDRAHQAVQFGVGLREVSGQDAVFLDALAGDRLELRAQGLEVAAEAFVPLRV